MGFGDALMATGRAKILAEADPTDRRPIAIGDGVAVRWDEVFENNPRLARPEQVAAGAAVRWLVDHPGNRPYVDYEAMQRDAGADPLPWPARRRAINAARAWRWRPGFGAAPGEIWLTEAERAWARDAIGTLAGSSGESRSRGGAAGGGNRPLLIVEPSVKPSASPNKAWRGWAALAEQLAPDWRLVRLGAHAAGPTVDGIAGLTTPSFRLACAVLARAAAVILPEGGLHHAAAALGVPGVVIFGGFIGPRTTGYGLHVNLWAGGAESPCGRREDCEHCRAAMAAITPERVDAALRISIGRSA